MTLRLMIVIGILLTFCYGEVADRGRMSDECEYPDSCSICFEDIGNVKWLVTIFRGGNVLFRWSPSAWTTPTRRSAWAPSSWPPVTVLPASVTFSPLRSPRTSYTTSVLSVLTSRSVNAMTAIFPSFNDCNSSLLQDLCLRIKIILLDISKFKAIYRSQCNS